MEGLTMNLDFSGLEIPGLFGISFFWIVAFWVLTIIIHITFAVAVYRDAKRLETPIFVESGIWLIATLVGGVFVAAIYWALHHSRLNPSTPIVVSDSDKETDL